MGAALPALVFQRRGRLTTIAFAALARHPVSFEPTGIGETFISDGSAENSAGPYARQGQGNEDRREPRPWTSTS